MKTETISIAGGGKFEFELAPYASVNIRFGI
jgi:hypothetical protein